MKTTRVKIPKVIVQDNSEPYKDRRVPENLFQHCNVVGLLGSMGQGKTTRFIEWFLMYNKTHSYDKLFVFSPSLLREEKAKNLTENKSCPVEVISKYTDQKLSEITDYIVNEIDEHKEFQKYKIIYEKFVRLRRKYPDGSIDMNEFADFFTPAELTLLEKYDYSLPEDKYKYGYPCFAMFFDDQIGNKKVFSPTCGGVCTETIVLSRHISCSVFLSVQIFKCGIGKSLRAGVVNIWLLFGTRSDELKKEIAAELASAVKPEILNEAWTWATSQNDHDFLLVDRRTKDRSRMLRKNWNEFIEIEGNE